MREQHKYLFQKGYKTVKTQTGNEFRNMLLLNIKLGFNIVGTFINNDDQIRIILEKKLDSLGK